VACAPGPAADRGPAPVLASGSPAATPPPSFCRSISCRRATSAGPGWPGRTYCHARLLEPQPAPCNTKQRRRQPRPAVPCDTNRWCRATQQQRTRATTLGAASTRGPPGEERATTPGSRPAGAQGHGPCSAGLLQVLVVVPGFPLALLSLMHRRGTSPAARWRRSPGTSVVSGWWLETREQLTLWPSCPP